MVGIAVQKSTRDLRLTWKGAECHLGHGLTPQTFATLGQDGRLRVKFSGYDEETRILLYSFGAEGSPLGCSSEGQEIKFGNEIRVDRRPSSHGVPQVDHAIPQRFIQGYQIDALTFAIEIPADFIKGQEVSPVIEQKKVAASSLDEWISANPGRCIKRGDLAHLLKEDDSKSAFQRATSQIKAFARQNPEVLYQIDRGPHKHVFVATFPTSEGGN